MVTRLVWIVFMSGSRMAKGIGAIVVNGWGRWEPSLIGFENNPLSLLASARGIFCMILKIFFADAGAPRASRRERGGFPDRTVDFRETHSPPRRDVFIPFGLDKFLASLVERPRTFEQLCRDLRVLERAGCKHGSMPGWFHATCASSLVSKPEHLQQWWWANIGGAGASAVLQLMNRVELERQRQLLL